jgi:TPR repeat protein
MRKIGVIIAFFCACGLAFSQEAKLYTAETAHYRISSQTSQSEVDEVSRILEACLVQYNNVFHFDLAQLPGKLTVKIFKDVDSFNVYLGTLVSETRSDFVFVAYSDPTRSELLAFTQEREKLLPSLIHQGCIQFLKAFVANPPVWLREGVAAYLEASEYDSKTASLVLKPNFLWLDSLKSILDGSSSGKLIPFSDLLLLTRESAEQNLDVFYPQAWGLVSFLLGSQDKITNRIFWDTLTALSPSASLDENSQNVRKKAFSWSSDQEFSKEFSSFIEGLKTDQELVKEGVDLYAKGEMDGAEKSFTSSLALEPDSGVACYYLGLIAYARKDYTKAYSLYLKAAELGVSGALVDYALGVNAFAGGNFADATKYLAKSKDAEPATYGDKVETLMQRMTSSEGGK